MQHLEESLKIGATLIHVSSHGELDHYLRAKMGEVFYQAYQNKGNFLLFEDNKGNSQPLTVANLIEILQRDIVRKEKT